MRFTPLCLPVGPRPPAALAASGRNFARTWSILSIGMPTFWLHEQRPFDADGKMKTVRDGILTIIGAAIIATCAFIVWTTDYSLIRAQMYALFAAVAGLLRIGATG
jgi:hypothetical protein